MNQELIAHGIANALSGCLGGLPMAGIMSRSTVNVSAGAKTRWSTIFNGFWILVCISFLPFVLENIPLPALAAALITSGWQLVKMGDLLNTLKVNTESGIQWIFTALADFFTNLVKATLSIIRVLSLLL